jgi:hypothetical protein
LFAGAFPFHQANEEYVPAKPSLVRDSENGFQLDADAIPFHTQSAKKLTLNKICLLCGGGRAT